MAYLYRLIVLAGVLFLLSPAAQASFPPVSESHWGNAAGTLCLSSSPLASAPCIVALADSTTESNLMGCYVSAVVSPTQQTVLCTRINVGALRGGNVWLTTSNVCPANSTLSVGACVCNSGFVESGSTCVPPAPVNNCSQFTGTPAGWYNGAGGTGLKTVCVQDSVNTSSGDSASPGCVLSGTADFAAGASPTAMQWGANLTWTGAKCNPSTFTNSGSTDTPAPTNCGPGQVAGTVNGQTVCAKAGSTDNTQTTTNNNSTTTAPDGTTTNTQTSDNQTCTATTCTTTTTTTTTTTPPGGTATTGTTTTTGTCTRGTAGCSPDGGEKESSFGGSCAAFTCGGDAIMCAVALEQHRRNCALFVDPSAESELYNTEKGKTGTQYENENVAVGPSNFSQANALGASAQCIQDKVVTVAGSTITLPFSQICSTLQHLGTVLMFIAFLTAYRIVSRG